MPSLGRPVFLAGHELAVRLVDGLDVVDDALLRRRLEGAELAGKLKDLIVHLEEWSGRFSMLEKTIQNNHLL